VTGEVTGVALFRQLARQAARHFLVAQPSKRPPGTWGSWLSRTALAELDKQENRWLETVCKMPFVTTRDVHGFKTAHRYRLRCLPGDVFTASAMAIEMKGPFMATNSSRADILRMRLKSLYDALHALPSTVPVAELAGLMQHQANLNFQIAELENQLAAELAAPTPAGSPARQPDGDIPEGRIEILGEEHHSGLYGRVFKGRQIDLNRIVAVKIIRPDWPDVADAIEHAKAIARAGTHANIVTVHCVERVHIPDCDKAQPAMIMEWLEGENLGDRLGGPQFNVAQVRQLCTGILDGVKHMHANAVAHGDLHPGNVIVVNDGTPKIIDVDPNKDISLARLSTISRRGAVQSDIEYCQNIIFRVFSHGPFSITTRNRMDAELKQANSIGDLRGVVEHVLQEESGIAQHQPRIDDDAAAVRRFEEIRQSFESVVSKSGFHDLIADRAVLAVCLAPDTRYKLDRKSIRGVLPPLAHEDLHCQSSTDRYTEISVAEHGPWKSVLDVDPQGVIRAASTLAIKGNVTDRLARAMFGDHRAEHLIRSTHLQHTLVYSLRLWAAVLRQWEVAGPFRLGVSLLAVQGWDLLLYDRELCNRPQEEPVLSADPVTISSMADFDDARVVFQTLQPAFDDIARGFGLGEWPLGSFGAN
jgi:hypothetical protein